MRAAVVLVTWVVLLGLLLGFVVSLCSVFAGIFGGYRGEEYIVFGGIGMVVFLGALVVLGALALVLSRHPATRRGRPGEELAVDEARMMQEIYRSLARMESRVDSLETILLDRPVRPVAGASEPREGAGRGA